jgi:alkanesulfonate monooxygenase SsuD/methylene tetrahydromethanopterin reductase-like flavin-dependent oxidoreductase (luciferase family)
MRTVWRDESASFAGAFVNFDAVRVYPKPIHAAGIPIVIGGNGDAALRRAASVGDGWYGFNLTVDQAAERLGALRRLCDEQQRPASAVRTAVAMIDSGPEDGDRLKALGIDEVVLVAAPPETTSEIDEWIAGLAAGWPR